MFDQSALVAETARLHKFALRLTKNKSDADDLVQATCLCALEKSDYFENGTSLFSWTSKIMFNTFVSNYRRRAKFESQYDPDSHVERLFVSPFQEIAAEMHDVKNAMRKLSSDHREILTLICVKGMRYTEVSELLQIPVGTVRSRLYRAREQLQAIMSLTDLSISRLTIQNKTPAKIKSSVMPIHRMEITHRDAA